MTKLVDDSADSIRTMSPSSSPPPPFAMCSQEEYHDRASSGESVSLWEVAPSEVATLLSTTIASTSSALHHGGGRRRQEQRGRVRLHSQWAIAKYYRSAAGGSRKYPPRSQEQLMMTMDHLTSLLYDRLGSHSRSISLYQFAQFWYDRVRAIQVELIVSSTSPSLVSVDLRKQVQFRIVSALLVFGYLLRDHPHHKEIQVQHNNLLQTALAEYGSSADIESTNTEDLSCDEDIIWIAGLTQMSACLERSITTNASNTASSSLLGGYAAMLWQYHYSFHMLDQKRHLLHHASPTKQGRHLEDVMHKVFVEMVSYAVREEYGSLLDLLITFEHGNDRQPWSENFTISRTSAPTDDDNHRRRLLARLSFASILHLLRWHIVRQYNVSWAPKEAVDANEVARLLWLPSAQTAVEFCQSCGLAIVPSTSDKNQPDGSTSAKIVFRAGPIQPVSNVQPFSRSVDDELVLGSFAKLDSCSRAKAEGLRLDASAESTSNTENLSQITAGAVSSLGKEALPFSTQRNGYYPENHSPFSSELSQHASVPLIDADGISIPPPSFWTALKTH